MRRADGLVTLSRREVCGGLATCFGAAVLSGCVDGSSGVVQTGPLGGPNGNNPDGGNHPIDAHQQQVDAGNTATCPSSGATDVGAPSAFVINQPVYKSAGNFFVVRDSGGLYALTARCTHEGATCVTSQGEFYCPRHGATFDYNGSVLGGPVFTGLKHYAMCTLSNGHVAVITSQTVPQSQRLVA
jgi:cytochrome b6-f complex iron-sulfur subunit